MNISTNTSLKDFNTFRIEARARQFVFIENNNDIKELHTIYKAEPKETFVLGGGSNVLFTRNFVGTILYSKLSDICIEKETKEHVLLKCGSGVNWDQFVAYCVEKNWGGIENLSDIPGNVGAAPVQNIGAYGVEAKDTIVKVEGIDFSTGKTFSYSNKDCCFTYRNSIFKTEKNKFISYVYFKLTKQHKLVTHYGKVKEELTKQGEETIQNIRNLIIAIRRSKLPGVDELGSGGSFFKNPVVPDNKAKQLQAEYPEMPQYIQPDGSVKLSAAWLIDNAGLKGLQHGDVATYHKQPLVIVNLNKASGKEIADFSEFIRKKVFEKYDLSLEPEVIFK
ncbi:MAG TPA: UDP-N-acetylenolpyruvoylglucosamine reductase [Bacteroidales bacterium]|nr:UDP-N-acetylenolpyruvoylglucosamine reductase [Bacteroidales bacterium]